MTVNGAVTLGPDHCAGYQPSRLANRKTQKYRGHLRKFAPDFATHSPQAFWVSFTLWKSSDAGGIKASSRWLSVATPPDSRPAMNRTPAGVPAFSRHTHTDPFLGRHSNSFQSKAPPKPDATLSHSPSTAEFRFTLFPTFHGCTLFPLDIGTIWLNFLQTVS